MVAQGVYVTILILIVIVMSVALSVSAIMIDQTLQISSNKFKNVKVNDALNDLANGTITQKIINEIKKLSKQD